MNSNLVKVVMTEEQLDNLIDVLQYVSNCEYEHYMEHLQEGNDVDIHLYTKVQELMHLDWSKV